MCFCLSEKCTLSGIGSIRPKLHKSYRLAWTETGNVAGGKNSHERGFARQLAEPLAAPLSLPNLYSGTKEDQQGQSKVKTTWSKVELEKIDNKSTMVRETGSVGGC